MRDYYAICKHYLERNKNILVDGYYVKKNSLNARRLKKIHFLLLILVLLIFFSSFIWFFKIGLFFKDKKEWYYYLAFKNYNVNNDEKALKYIKKAFDRDKDNQEMHRLMIKIYEKRGVFHEAKQQLLLINQTNNTHYYYWLMGNALDEMGDLNESLHYFNEGIKEYPLYVENYISAGLWYYKSGELKTALEHFEHGKKLVKISYPDDELKQKERLGIIHASIGFVYQKNGNNSEAEKEFEIAKSKNRDSINYVSDYLGT